MREIVRDFSLPVLLRSLAVLVRRAANRGLYHTAKCIIDVACGKKWRGAQKPKSLGVGKVGWGSRLAALQKFTHMISDTASNACFKKYANICGDTLEVSPILAIAIY